MHTEGILAPGIAQAAREQYAAVGPAAQTTVREVAKAMEFGREEYDERVTSEVTETARQTIFAEQLAVRVDDAEGFEAWRAETDHEVRVVGHDAVDRVAWHAAPAAGRAVAATFQNESEAAVSTVRRAAFNRIYREELCEP